MNRTYHHLEFADVGEAAAFVAALSRMLSSPRGAAFVARPDSGIGQAIGPIEVWSGATGANHTVVVYLSDAALAAARLAFSPVPIQAANQLNTLPAGCSLVIDDAHLAPLGLDDAQRLIAR